MARRQLPVIAVRSGFQSLFLNLVQYQKNMIGSGIHPHMFSYARSIKGKLITFINHLKNLYESLLIKRKRDQ